MNQSSEKTSMIVGVAALALCVAIGAIPAFSASFFHAYIFGWLFWLGISLGGMALTMLHYLTGGDWGVLIRPITFSSARVMPLMLVLFVPICFGLRALFPWAQADVVAHDAILMHEQPYLNPSFFMVRAVIYFAIWCGLVWSMMQTPQEKASILRRISAGGLVIYVLTMTLGGVDWIMSRQAHWSSTVFGFIMVISQTFTALCFAIVVFWRRMKVPAIRAFAKPQDFVDLGNLILTLLILWAYMNFSQFLVTWTGNEQDDIGYYVQRTYGGWRVVAGIIVFIHFLIPLILLMFRDLKKNIHRLGIFCAILLGLRVMDLYWIVGPFGHDVHSGFTLSPLDVLAWVGIGGIWYSVFLRFLNRSAPLALTAGSSDEVYGKHTA